MSEGLLQTRFRHWRYLWLIFTAVVALTLPATPRPQAHPKTGDNSAQPSEILNSLQSYTYVKSSATKPLIYANNYILIDSQTNEVLISKNPYEPVPVASTTKMTTALVAIENLPLNQVVTVSPKATGINGSKIQLLAQEQITVGNLLKGLLIQSGNDAAMTLAEAYSHEVGNYRPFAEKMNEFIRFHRLTATAFADPAGLDDDNGHSSAFDLSQIARLLLQNPTLRRIVTTPGETITSVNGQQSHQLKNSNRLIVNDNPYYLPNAIGVKTGFTLAAGHCLVSGYQLKDRLLIGVVLNTVESTITASAAEMRKLFLWANDNVSVGSY